MGLFGELFHAVDQGIKTVKAGHKTADSEQNAIEQVEADKTSFLNNLSCLGDVISIDGNRANSKRYSEYLGYKHKNYCNEYKSYSAKENISSIHSTGYSGTISSSGTVDIHENVDIIYDPTTIEESVGFHYDDLAYKVVKSGEQNTVKKKENKFWRKGGKFYMEILCGQEYNSMSPEENMKKYTKFQLFIVIFGIVSWILFAFGLVYNSFTNITSEDFLSKILTFWLLFEMILHIVYIVRSIRLSTKARMRDGSTIFLILVSGFTNLLSMGCFLSPENISRELIYVIFALTIVIFLILLKRIVSHLSVLGVNKKKKLDNMLSDIISYNIM